MKVIPGKMSYKARTELDALRQEMRKVNPDPEKINHFLNGDKYDRPIH